MKKEKKEQILLRKVDKKLHRLYKFYAKRNILLEIEHMDIDKQIVSIKISREWFDGMKIGITFLCLISNKIKKLAGRYIGGNIK